MAASICPICNAAVDSSDAACRHCGVEFMRLPAISLTRPVVYRTAPTVIELTAKKWKAVMLFGVLVAITFGALAGLAAFLIQPEPHSIEAIPVLASAALSIVGVVIYALGRTAAWWYHG